MRFLTDHIVDGDSANHQLQVEVQDEPGQGGASHRYKITGFDAGTNPSHQYPEGQFDKVVLFQNGPIKEFGVNGLTHEALIAILIDRLRGFQSGPYKCQDNSYALHHLSAALDFLQKRTRERIARNVEGTHTV